MTHPLQHLLDNLSSGSPLAIQAALKEIVRYIIAQEKPDDVPSATPDDVF